MSLRGPRVSLADLTEVERLRLEHECMASTLVEVERLASEKTMKHLRRYYAETLLADLEARS